MKTKLNEDLKEAMKTKNVIKRDTIRNIKKAIMEYETAPGHTEATDDQVLKIIQKLAKQGTESCKIYQEAGRDDLYNAEKAQVDVLTSYLPESLTDEKLTAIIIKYHTDNPEAKMGDVMKYLNKEYAGQFDGKTAASLVKRIL